MAFNHAYRLAACTGLCGMHICAMYLCLMFARGIRTSHGIVHPDLERPNEQQRVHGQD